MVAYLRRLDYAINSKRVRRLMRLMGIEAIYPRRSSSSPGKGHKRYPYLLRNLPIRAGRIRLDAPYFSYFVV